jgi:hypothetical protein
LLLSIRVKRRFLGKAQARYQVVTRSPPCLCIASPLPWARLVRQAGGKRVQYTAVPISPQPKGHCAAGGLTFALLHCSSFRYFQSPCGVLCTFRSSYLCHIGCRADRGVLSETPRRIRLQVQAALHRRRQQSAGNSRQSVPREEQTRSNGTVAHSLTRGALPCSCTVTHSPKGGGLNWGPCAPCTQKAPQGQASGSRPRRGRCLSEDPLRPPQAVLSRSPV